MLKDQTNNTLELQNGSQNKRTFDSLTRDNVAMLGSRAPTLPPASVDGDIEGEYLKYLQP